MELHRVRILSVLLVLFTNSALAGVGSVIVPTGLATRPDCGELLFHHLESPAAKHEDWDSLAEKLKSVASATLQVHVDLNSQSVSLADLIQLVQPLAGVQFRQITTVHPKGKALFTFVADGTSEALGGLVDRVDKAALTATYQFLYYVAKYPASIFPRLIIPLDESLSEAELNGAEARIMEEMKLKHGFSVYNVSEGRMIFVLPRLGLTREINHDLLTSLKVNTTWMRRLPVNWTRWFLDKTDSFDKKTAMLSGEWVMLSPGGFEALYDFVRRENAGLPEIHGIDNVLQQILREDFSHRDEIITPQAVKAAAKAVVREEAEADMQTPMTPAARRRILGFLKPYRSGPGLGQAHGIRLALLNYARTVSDARARNELKAEILRLDFAAYDYQSLRKPNANAAHDRFDKVWRAILRSQKNKYASRPLTFSNIVGAIRELEEST